MEYIDQTYQDFIEKKRYIHKPSGFEIPESLLNINLFPFQRYIVRLALSKGKFAVWADCGLGKTIMQLDWAQQVLNRTNKPVLILCPLAVSGQTILEGEKFAIHVSKYKKQTEPGIYITNYEQIENIDCSIFSGVVLDESSILKNYSGAYKQLIIERFERTEYKLACTATPSPNDELEIGNHAEFLNVMTSQDMRAIYFTTDKDLIKGDKYRLKKHAVKDFYKWVSTWALMIGKPSDIGFDDEGYQLPPLKFVERKVVTAARDNGILFNSVAVSATNFNQELRITKLQRMSEVVDIVNNSDEEFIIWIKHNDEGEYLRGMIPDAIEVSGSHSPEDKEGLFLAFAAGRHRVLITKSKIGSLGLNFQNCHNQIFASLDFSFETLYQSIRRSYRFGQKHSVNIYLITTDTMQNVIASIEEKEEKFLLMQKEMREAILSNIEKVFENTEREIYTAPEFTLIKNDCVAETASLSDNSIDYSFFSPPFGALYVFSNDPRDMSNVKNNAEFLKHFNFLLQQLYRVIKPGRLVSIHMMQSTTLLGRDGYYSIVDFRGDLIRMFQAAGFYFHAENMIRKDPKTAAIRTKNRQLMHGTTKKDSSIVRPGLADYMLHFRKPGENEVPIQNNIPFDLWCKIAEPVWIDVQEGDTLDYRAGRAEKDDRHITPTQLKPIEWCYMMYTNKGDTVYSPFSGIASEGWQALKMGRKYMGVELKKSYYDQSIKNLKMALDTNSQLPLMFAE
jgi:DNA modification methylase